MQALVVASRPSPLRCALCHDDLEVAAWCAECGTVLHPGCAREVSRCPTLGCAGVKLPPRRRFHVVGVAPGEPVLFTTPGIVVGNLLFAFVGIVLAVVALAAVPTSSVAPTLETLRELGLEPRPPVAPGTTVIDARVRRSNAWSSSSDDSSPR